MTEKKTCRIYVALDSDGDYVAAVDADDIHSAAADGNLHADYRVISADLRATLPEPIGDEHPALVQVDAPDVVASAEATAA